ncbi:SDR family NAD(P)-dependent oxidoreductase [Companilactobacillus kimchiensis]|uniref:Short-chain dehydrogenases reductases family protein n=1 Tax=Companilactobacillus kimchiensis TaxID=993692 RepID=A0A0R2LAV2_9LACO|nr:SDR family oxidoreductase [Companilactobacillus kimchiensis]KRN98843.1 short-chain dehydrogenases reductases family protein [Companilactobacillus kimchiensis]
MSTIVIGSDNGVGFEVAKLYGQKGQRIILVSRNQAMLDMATKELISQNISTTNYVCDVNDFEAVTKMMTEIAAKDDGLTHLVFNVGNKHLDDPLASNADLINDIFKTNVLSAIVSSKAFIKQTNPKLKRSIIFTGGGAAICPSAKASTLSLTKAALRSYAYTLHEQVASQDIFVGLVTIQGLIGSSVEMAPAKIAQSYWKLLMQRDKTEAFYPENVSGSEFK